MFGFLEEFELLTSLACVVGLSAAAGAGDFGARTPEPEDGHVLAVGLGQHLAVLVLVAEVGLAGLEPAHVATRALGSEAALGLQDAVQGGLELVQLFLRHHLQHFLHGQDVGAAPGRAGRAFGAGVL